MHYREKENFYFDSTNHDDVIKWKHFPRYWPFVRGIHRSPVNYPHKGQWRGASMFSLICAWINGWVNYREAGDLRRQHLGHIPPLKIQNPSYFFMTLSFTGTIQNFSSHFNQYSLIDPSWCNIPSWLWQGFNHWFRKLWRRVWHHRHFGNRIHENNIFIFYPDKHKRNWKIVSTINVTYAPIQINWVRNIAPNYFNQQQPASSFTTVSNVMVHLCELRHQ